jgi:alkanesulfonate monooxygenase SsuD/methylene tetrahydromethanopterin reductase-like flavin-dependent oxidoreductase (luciferase family)
VTPVGNEARHVSLGLIIPTSTQEELTSKGSSTTGTTGSASELSELCRRAEAAGADSLWAVDHLYWPHPVAEAMTTLAVAATATETPTLGTCVLQLPLRQPAAVAKQATALQILSGGRFVLGLGSGSHEGEYTRAGVDFRRRGRFMDLGVARLREAWAARPHAPWAGEAAGPAAYVQSPTSAPVPLWFGGASTAARRRAASVGDGWIPLFLTPDEYGAALVSLRKETAEAGRDPASVEAGVVVYASVGDDDPLERGTTWLSHLYRLPAKAFRRHLVAGPAQACAAALQRFAQAGARHIVVMIAGSPAVEQFGAIRSAWGAAGGAERVMAGASR